MHEHYYTNKPKSIAKVGMLEVTLRGETLLFLTASGIFSYKKIDNGTALLVEKMIINDNDRILDLGCGYGIIGIAAARLGKDIKLVLTDINSRATNLTKKNLVLNNIEQGLVKNGHLYEPVSNEKFDTILCNLPMSAGLDLVYKIIEDGYRYLNTGGSFQSVARKGSKRVEKKMFDIYGNIKIMAKKGGYRVFISNKINNRQSREK
jgi:16S rRNA G1207 methylase RsmC|tara:strand:- start:4068 stop:4685 length:618 start_codon:yes stop_codon:yes gene_type:complete